MLHAINIFLLPRPEILWKANKNLHFLHFIVLKTQKLERSHKKQQQNSTKYSTSHLVEGGDAPHESRCFINSLTLL